jgi:hypothetical protein
MKVYKNAIEPELLAEIRTAFDRIKDEIGFTDRYYIDYNDRYLMSTFRKFITNPDCLPILREGDNALHMERAVFGVDGAWGTLTQMNSPEKMQPYFKEIVKKIYGVMAPVGNFVQHPVDLMFVRVHLPADLHVDKLHERAEHDDGYTLIIPLTFDSNIKTVVWDQEFYSRTEAEAWKRSVLDNKEPETTSGVPQGVDLQHCTVGDKFLPDYLDNVQLAEWEPGSIIVFERQRIHCSSNFRNHLPFKDYVLIHSQDGRYADN